MDSDQYLIMVNAQLKEAEENMKLSEKKYREDKGKYESILTFREKYITWVRGMENERTGL